MPLQFLPFHMIGKTLPEDTLLAFFHKNNVKKPVIKLRPRHKIEIWANETSIQHFEQDIMAGYIDHPAESSVPLPIFL